jgi:hypothetical protein
MRFTLWEWRTPRRIPERVRRSASVSGEASGISNPDYSGRSAKTSSKRSSIARHDRSSEGW